MNWILCCEELYPYPPDERELAAEEHVAGIAENCYFAREEIKNQAPKPEEESESTGNRRIQRKGGGRSGKSSRDKIRVISPDQPIPGRTPTAPSLVPAGSKNDWF